MSLTQKAMGKGQRNKKRKSDGRNDSTIEWQLQLEKLEADLFDMRYTLETTVKEVAFLKAENNELKETLAEERGATRVLTNELNEQQQYSRKNNIRIFGLRDTDPKENAFATEDIVIQMFRNKLKKEILHSDIEIAHRVGRFSPDRDRAIIVRFISRKAKADVIYHRRSLKGSGISIAEDLTSKNVRRLTQLKDLDCVTQSWSYDGKLFAKNSQNAVREVKGLEILSEKLFENKPADARPPRGQYNHNRQNATQQRRGQPVRSSVPKSPTTPSLTTAVTAVTTLTTATTIAAVTSVTTVAPTSTATTPTTTVAVNPSQQGQSARGAYASDDDDIAEVMMTSLPVIETSGPSASSTPKALDK